MNCQGDVRGVRPSALEETARALARSTMRLVVSIGLLWCNPVGASETAHDEAPVEAADSVGVCREAGADSASCVIDILHRAIHDVGASSDLGFEERCQALNPAVVAAFDMNFMALKSLGPRAQELGEAEREKWIDSFTRFTVSTYVRRLGDAPGRTFEILGEKPARKDTTLVRGRVVRSSSDTVSVDYRMHQLDGSWKVVDVYSQGTISQLALRRAEVASLLERMNFEEVLVHLDDLAKIP